MRIEVGKPAQADAVLDEADSLAEWEEAVEAALDDSSGEVHLQMHPASPPRFALTDAMSAVVGAVERAGSRAPEVVAWVASGKAREVVSAALPGGTRGMLRLHFQGLTVGIVEGDIAVTAADAIVNASNTRLELGGGVSGAIARRAGRGLQAEMRGIARTRTLRPGDAVLTGSHGLPSAPYIVHVATATGGEEAVRTGLRNALQVAEGARVSRLAVPALGAGTGGVEVETCARVYREVLAEHAASGRPPREVVIVLHGAAAFDTFARELGSASTAE